MGLGGSCSTLYGPVLSRRHGRSLGINLGDPNKKVCSWGCLYCQCGQGERRAIGKQDCLPSRQEVLQKLSTTLETCGPIDSVTLAGNSEPGAHPDFLEIVRDVLQLKDSLRAEWIFNCLTNGSELGNDAVVEGCNLLDEAWVKLDCGNDTLFKRLNRPIAKIGNLSDHLSWVRRLARPRIQSLFWASKTYPRACNWTDENRQALLNAYNLVKPVEIHLTTVERQPAWSGAQPVPAEELNSFCDYLERNGFNVRAFS